MTEPAQNPQNPEVTLKFPLDFVNALLGVVAEAPVPYRVSAPLVAAIHKQVEDQFKPKMEGEGDPVSGEAGKPADGEAAAAGAAGQQSETVVEEK